MQNCEQMDFPTKEIKGAMLVWMQLGASGQDRSRYFKMNFKEAFKTLIGVLNDQKP